jgi:hypothetical protein
MSARKTDGFGPLVLIAAEVIVILFVAVAILVTEFV